ncbi:acyltransferase domain-containing protein [Fodinicola acaciae]|uniref:acyltransferase domain-containing protein n=1 Tax=Fodinicola acaciae TaxID=2681555 RepID=UPI002483BB3B|nr:acyltransferase domain-containing protein [Fodinicola acaciae]
MEKSATFRIPKPERAEQLARSLGMSAEDRAEMLRFPPRHGTELWDQLEKAYHSLVEAMGTTGPLPDWPVLPERHGALARYGYVWVFLAATDVAREYHAARGISDEVSWASLGILADQMRNRRAVYGEGGLHTQNWVTHHFRGAVYPLGRLHFERRPIWFDAGPPPAPGRGDDALGLHIPEGRLTPASCDESIRTAQAFFQRHYPDHDYRYATCVSWVLDPQLTEYLAYDTNILAFQRRFTLIPLENPDQDDNKTIVEFVFRRPLDELDRLPRDTTLQRAIIDHIQAGRRWQFRTGWFRV